MVKIHKTAIRYFDFTEKVNGTMTESVRSQCVSSLGLIYSSFHTGHTNSTHKLAVQLNAWHKVYRLTRESGHPLTSWTSGLCCSYAAEHQTLPNKKTMAMERVLQVPPMYLLCHSVSACRQSLNCSPKPIMFYMYKKGLSCSHAELVNT